MMQNGSNPLYSMFGNNMGNVMTGPFGNMMNLVNNFQQFKKSYNGTPQTAYQQVQQMLNNGQIDQRQFNYMANMANQVLKMLGLN